MEELKNVFESNTVFYIILALSLILCVVFWVVLHKKEKEMKTLRAEQMFNLNEAYSLTIEELLDAIEHGYVTEFSSWGCAGKIYTSPNKYFLLKILDDKYCAIQKGTSSKCEIVHTKKLKELFKHEIQNPRI